MVNSRNLFTPLLVVVLLCYCSMAVFACGFVFVPHGHKINWYKKLIYLQCILQKIICGWNVWYYCNKIVEPIGRANFFVTGSVFCSFNLPTRFATFTKQFIFLMGWKKAMLCILTPSYIKYINKTKLHPIGSFLVAICVTCSRIKYIALFYMHNINKSIERSVFLIRLVSAFFMVLMCPPVGTYQVDSFNLWN